MIHLFFKPCLNSIAMKFFKSFFVLLFAVFFISSLQAQKIETTYNWGAFDHSCWKVQPSYTGPTTEGYVMIGTKFFEPNNTSLYIQGFDPDGKSRFLRAHTPHGFTSLQTFWKSFIASPDKKSFFTVAKGTKSGSSKAYALLTDNYGFKIRDYISDIPNGIEFGGVTNAKNGGWIATGGDGSGQLISSKFSSAGRLEWIKTYPQNGFGWSITPVLTGGYILAGTRNIIKIDEDGNLVWATVLNLPPSAMPDGSAFTYTEFEEVIEIPFMGVIVTGSCFSNQTSAAYTALVDYTGPVIWTNVHGSQLTSLPGTPVSWISSAVNEGLFIVTSWRTGPVSSGGTMYYQRQFLLNGALSGGENSLGNTIPVQEAFFIKSANKYIVGGTRGGYSASYSYINSQIIPGLGGIRRSDYENLPVEKSNELGGLVRVNFNNTEPKYKLPVSSRVFNSVLRVYPNPSTGLINVGGKIEPGAIIRVTDMMGRVVLEKKTILSDPITELNLTGFGKGIFNVAVVGSIQNETKKVIVQ